MLPCVTSLASMLSEESYREDAFIIKELLLSFWIRPGMHFVVRPSIGRNVSCTVGDFTSHLGLFFRRCDFLIFYTMVFSALPFKCNHIPRCLPYLSLVLSIYLGYNTVATPLWFIVPFYRDCVNNQFEAPAGDVRRCSVQCNAQTFCVQAQIPEEHLKVQWSNKYSGTSLIWRGREERKRGREEEREEGDGGEGGGMAWTGFTDWSICFPHCEYASYHTQWWKPCLCTCCDYHNLCHSHV